MAFPIDLQARLDADLAEPAPAPLAPPIERPSASAVWLNRYAELGEDFSTDCSAETLGPARWIAHSESAASLLGWTPDWPLDPQALEVFSGNQVWRGMRPVATVYSGHQFGVWAGQLGDGRALLLGELQTPAGSLEIQLKGSGQTPYSRRGDGRAVLRSSIREFLASEAMHALGIPSTRALCLTGSDLPVWRETQETAAIVTRLAPSFVRFGHFEHFAFRGLHGPLKRLADHVLTAHLPHCWQAAQPYLALLEHAVHSTASLMAAWQAVGFCHGVMNTDNMSILGLTLDYGPFGFLDSYDPEHICNHSDSAGRYAYQNQPQIAWWNLRVLAQALLPLIDDQSAVEAVLASYKPLFSAAMIEHWRRKFGFTEVDTEATELIDAILSLMAADGVDYTIFFRRLSRLASHAPADQSASHTAVRDLFLQRDAYDAWAARYVHKLQMQGSIDGPRQAEMLRVNPKFILRNHLAEGAIRQAQQGDYREIERLHRMLQKPYDDQPEFEADAGFPPSWAAAIEVSCSS